PDLSRRSPPGQSTRVGTHPAPPSHRRSFPAVLEAVNGRECLGRRECPLLAGRGGVPTEHGPRPPPGNLHQIALAHPPGEGRVSVCVAESVGIQPALDLRLPPPRPEKLG